MTDESNGYEKIADLYAKSRRDTGAATIASWAGSLPEGAVILDLGCGTGIPVTQILLDAKLNVCALDASPAMTETFHKHFPGIPVACEPVEKSAFFNRTFDGIIAIGLLFLLPEDTQRIVIAKMAAALNPGGRLLFSAPSQQTSWTDVLTGKLSRSLGAMEYGALLADAGLFAEEGLTDEGGNYYFSALKKPENGSPAL